MEVKVCRNCRRLYKHLFGPELCQDCAKLLAQEQQSQEEQKTYGNQGLQPSPQALTEEEHNSNLKPLNNKFRGTSIKTPVKEELAKFEQVRDYIMANPRASVAQISLANDVPPTKLFEWIREDRLEFSDDSEYAWFPCESCGTRIQSGRLCNRCKTK